MDFEESKASIAGELCGDCNNEVAQGALSGSKRCCFYWFWPSAFTALVEFCFWLEVLDLRARRFRVDWLGWRVARR